MRKIEGIRGLTHPLFTGGGPVAEQRVHEGVGRAGEKEGELLNRAHPRRRLVSEYPHQCRGGRPADRGRSGSCRARRLIADEQKNKPRT